MSKTRARSFGRQSNTDFGTATFPIKGLSQFDWSHTTSFTSDFGYLRPIEVDDLIVGTRMRCNLAYVLNMDPLKKPLYAGINVTFDAVYVSDNLLGYDSQTFFNPAEHLKVGVEPTDVVQPEFNSYNSLYLYYTCGTSHGYDSGSKVFTAGSTMYIPQPIYNTLYESLGYPFDSEAYDQLPYLNLVISGDTNPYGDSVSVATLLNPFSSYYDENSPSTLYDSDGLKRTADLVLEGVYKSSSNYWHFLDSNSLLKISNWATREIPTDVVGSFYQTCNLSPAANIIPIMTYWRFVMMCASSSFVESHGEIFNANDNSSLITAFYNAGYCFDKPASTSNWIEFYTYFDVDRFIRDIGFDSYQASIDVYKSYLYSVFYINNEVLDLRPIFAYRVAYNDLYVNTNIHDCNDYRRVHIDDYYDKFYDAYFFDYRDNNDDLEISSDSRFLDLSLEKRWWSNDMFTSAVPADKSSAANAIEIPSTGLSVMDLRGLNISQMVADKLAYAGERVTDTIPSIFGFRSPELSYRYARHIGRIVDRPRVDNVLQNSQTTDTSPLATPAGYGYGSKSGNFFDFQMPWYGFILVLTSVMTEPVYRDNVDRMLYKKEYEDFILPDYQEIGDVTVNNNEIRSFETGVFGWQRSYYYMIRKNSSIRGNMRFSEKLDWNLARDMRDGFALNADFCRPDSSDRLDRIFANTSDGIHHFNFFVGFDMQVVEPLRRDIHYHL